ncbi:IS630 family transposase, partial [Escherichia fergusonii]|nr:IS630 family transposase [Escherichia fergusonii]
LQCRSMWQLLKKVRHFMETVSPFPGANMGWQKCSGIRRSYLAHANSGSVHGIYNHAQYLDKRR